MIAALVPAAGLSTRMGRPKLVLPLGGEPVIARVVRALRDGGAGVVLVVAPPPEVEGARALADAAAAAGADVLSLDAPTADMRATVERGIAALAARVEPIGLLLAPGDSPGLSAGLVARVVEAFLRDPGRVVVPVVGERRGHPLALPWGLATAIRGLPAGVGVNALLAAEADRVVRLDVGDPGALADLDTPEEYERWAARTNSFGFPSGRPFRAGGGPG